MKSDPNTNMILNVPFTLPRDELQANLAIGPGSKFEAAFEELLQQVDAIARPKALYQVAYIEKRGPAEITIADTTFHSPAMRANLDNIGRVFPYIATCGTEVDEIPIDPDDMIQTYWHSIIKLALLRISVAFLRQTIQERYRLTKLSAMNPGSGEAGVWPIEEQRLLFSLFGGSTAVEQAIGVQLLPSYLMTPDMSASGILFPSEKTFFNCQLCQREDCPSRQAPFDAVLWESVQ
ncbi:hypothetical protein ACFLZW_01550 [Chloroflexota bacterium]